MPRDLELQVDQPRGRDGAHVHHRPLALLQQVDRAAGVLLGQLDIDELVRLTPRA